MNIRHESRSDKWYTPVSIIERARRVIPMIDLDPASDAFGNSRIGARRYLTEQDDALVTKWCYISGRPISIYLNPPGGKVGNESKAILFWIKLMELRQRGLLREAIYMGFSLEQLQTSQSKGVPSIGEFPFCVPAKRVAFDGPDGVKGRAPSHSNVIVYVPGTVDNRYKFYKAFIDLGVVVNYEG